MKYINEYVFTVVSRGNPSIAVMSGTCIASKFPKLVSDMTNTGFLVIISAVNKIPNKFTYAQGILNNDK